MIRALAHGATILTLSVLLASTAAEAQRGSSKDQMSDEAIAARRECFAEAQARFPRPTGQPAVNDRRSMAYRDCARRMGVRP